MKGKALRLSKECIFTWFSFNLSRILRYVNIVYCISLLGYSYTCNPKTINLQQNFLKMNLKSMVICVVVRVKPENEAIY